MLTTNVLDSSGAAIIAVTGGLLYLGERRRTLGVGDYQGFGVWVVPPRWFTAFFRSVEGRIRWDRMCIEGMCLTWLVSGLVATVSGGPPGSAIYQATVGLVLVTLCLSAVVGACVGIIRRQRR
jgi:hypothetical protein